MAERERSSGEEEEEGGGATVGSGGEQADRVDRRFRARLIATRGATVAAADSPGERIDRIGERHATDRRWRTGGVDDETARARRARSSDMAAALRGPAAARRSIAIVEIVVDRVGLMASESRLLFICDMSSYPDAVDISQLSTNTSETPPTVNEVYLHLHIVNHDGVTFIDTRSERFYAKLQRRRLELTQATPDQEVDDEAVYLNVAGECPKGRVYGLGSLGRKKRRYADPGASTSQMPEMVPRSEFDIVAEQLRKVVAFMHQQFGMTMDGAGLSQPTTTTTTTTTS
ncbi:hypothetical protein Scep_004252 [Stephania cephalantha]|uniref:Uncharacterized protein n=1 Tax=Stephania cephalantha TaxID=152367 RepID=A0AAP0KS38_9MAGN